MKEKLLLRTATEAYCYQPCQIVCVEADGNYSNLHLSNGNDYLLSFQLGQVESIIKEQLSYTHCSFVRVGKSLIINLDELISISLPRQTLEMHLPSGEKMLLNASREALKKLMNLLEEHQKNGMLRSINVRPTQDRAPALLRGHRNAAINEDDIRVIIGMHILR